MLQLVLLAQNLTRNSLRTVLTVVAVALPLAIFCLALGTHNIIQQTIRSAEKNLRLVVHNKITIVNPLPEGYRRKIEALDPNRTKIRAVCGMAWFGGHVKDDPYPFPSLAGDPDTFPIVYSMYEMTDDERRAWYADRRAAIVGPQLAEHFDWRVGQLVTLSSSVPPYVEMEFKIIKIAQKAQDPNMFALRRDYLEEERKQAGGETGYINMFWVKCHSRTALEEIREKVDELFVNSERETKTMEEHVFLANFLSMQGDISNMMLWIGLAVVSVVVMIAGNTMAMTFRERTRELAVLKTLGFGSSAIFSMLLCESLLISLLGWMFGCLPTYVILNNISVKFLQLGPITKIPIPTETVFEGLLICLVVGLMAGVVPASRAWRLNVVDALRP